jgi:hypothetical protein
VGFELALAIDERELLTHAGDVSMAFHCLDLEGLSVDVLSTILMSTQSRQLRICESEVVILEAQKSLVLH